MLMEATTMMVMAIMIKMSMVWMILVMLVVMRGAEVLPLT